VPARRFLVPLAAAALLAGCGDRHLVLRVDVLSFIAPADRQRDFGPIPAVPGGVATGEVALVDNADVSLLQGLGDATDIQDVTVTFDAQAIDADGAGTDTVRVYLADTQTDARLTPPVLEQIITLSPGQTTPVHAELSSDPRVVALFGQRNLHLTVTTSMRGPTSGNALSGTFQLTGLRGVVVAGWKGF